MKIAVKDIDKVADSVALTAILEGSLSDLDKKYNFSDGKTYRYMAAATSGDYQPNDASGATGWWRGCEMALGIVYPAIDGYDFVGNLATEIIGANATKWISYFEKKGITPITISTETKSRHWGNVTTIERDGLEPVNIGDTCFNVTTDSLQICNNSLVWVDMDSSISIAIHSTGYLASGTPSIAFFVVTNIIELSVLGNGTKTIYYELAVPFDCSSATFNVTTWKRNDPTNHRLTAYIDGVADSIISDYDIEATGDMVYEDKSVAFGDTLTKGQRLSIQLVTVNVGGSLTAHRELYIKFDR